MARMLSQQRPSRGELLPRMGGGFDQLQRQIDRIFDDFAGGWGMPSMIGMERGMERELMPSMDVSEVGDRLMVTAELPGVDEKDVDISVSDQTLTISGEKKAEMEHKDGDGYRRERSYGRFSRSVALPFEIDPKMVEARFDKGVLTLTIGKPAEAQMKTHKIQIKH